MTQEVLRFPQGFFWGAATSAYQVEGGIDSCDWARAAKDGRVPPAGQAGNHYYFYQSDFDWAHRLGQNSQRLSFEWSRLEPKPGKFNQREIEHYQKVITALHSRHLEPFVSLWHFTLPEWLAEKGGWQNPQAVKDFSRYVKTIIPYFKNRVKFWLTMNEPEVYLLKGYLQAKWPPFKKSWRLALKVKEHLLQAHQTAFQIIKEYQPQAQVSLAVNLTYLAPVNKYSPLDWFLVLAGRYANGVFLRENRKFLDFLAINYYTCHRWQFAGPWRSWHPLENVIPARQGVQEIDPRLRGDDTRHPIVAGCRLRRDDKGWWREIPQGVLTDMGWEIYPQGIYRVLRPLKKYHLPVYITENGLADAADKKRAKFIREHLFWLHRAQQKGIDIHGYFHWSLLDNFEWADGFGPRFGLLAVDYKTQKRTPRPSAWEYAKICQSNQLVFKDQGD